MCRSLMYVNNCLWLIRVDSQRLLLPLLSALSFDYQTMICIGGVLILLYILNREGFAVNVMGEDREMEMHNLGPCPRATSRNYMHKTTTNDTLVTLQVLANPADVLLNIASFRALLGFRHLLLRSDPSSKANCHDAAYSDLKCLKDDSRYLQFGLLDGAHVDIHD
jgi:hypothetical protein